jgi:hypothetical protein
MSKEHDILAKENGNLSRKHETRPKTKKKAKNRETSVRDPRILDICKGHKKQET